MTRRSWTASSPSQFWRVPTNTQTCFWYFLASHNGRSLRRRSTNISFSFLFVLAVMNINHEMTMTIGFVVAPKKEPTLFFSYLFCSKTWNPFRLEKKRICLLISWQSSGGCFLLTFGHNKTRGLMRRTSWFFNYTSWTFRDPHFLFPVLVNVVCSCWNDRTQQHLDQKHVWLPPVFKRRKIQDALLMQATISWE